MGFDDGDDKLRRNVVVWSAAIILVWFLGGRLSTSSAYGPVIWTNYSPGRAWVACLLATAYFFSRFHFSENRVQANAAMVKEWSANVRGTMQRWTYRHFAQMARTGRYVSGYLNAPQVFEEMYQDYGQRHSDDPFTRVTLMLLGARSSTELSWYQGLYGIKYEGPRRSGHTLRGVATTPLSVEYTGWRRWWLATVSAWRLAVYSASSTTLLVPYLLAAGALTICCAKIVQHYLL